ncbi:MAG: MutS-related protein [Sarcina sp.]
MEAGKLIALYTVIIVVVLIIADRISEASRKRYFKEDIRDSYGKRSHYKKKPLDRENIESYFRNCKEDADFFIDNITWHDLNMDEIFKLINNVQSSVGSEVLYKLLRMPTFSAEDLEKREELLKYFKENATDRFNIQYSIRSILGKREIAKLSNYFFKPKKFSGSKLGLHLTLRWSIVVLLLLAVVLRNVTPFYFAVLIIVINGSMTGMAKKDTEYVLEDYSYMINLIKCAHKIRSLNIKEINDKYPKLDEALKSFKSINNKALNEAISISGGSAGAIKIYLNGIFLIDIINYEKAGKVICDNPESIRVLYDYVGELDALIGVTSFRETLAYYTKPEYTEKVSLEFKDIYNPLLKEPIPNSFKSEKSILLTGSNASGKSTFLRTVGLNALLGQTINTVCAKKYKASMFRIYSSMALQDSILKSESYYIVEIKSLKRILDSMEYEYPILCIVDEILRGTNTAERIGASSEILKYIGEDKDMFCLAATHDIELTYMMEDIFDNYSFEEKVVKKEIVFDYKLKTGRSKTRNAIKILEFMGYNKEITRRAEKKATRFLETKSWDD